MSGLSEHADSSFYGTGVGVCRGCGTWLKSNENDGYCDYCARPGSIFTASKRWAEEIGGDVAVAIRYRLYLFSDAQLYATTRRAAGFALDHLGRDAA